MTLDGAYTATVDRIVEGVAVLLVESDGETVDERRLPETELPAGVTAGSVCELQFSEGELVSMTADPEATERRRERVRERFERLSRRLGGDDTE